ncbi:MAG: thiamine biosynthesis protein ApbE [Phenylobacterium sp.]|uniref:FAD:protein FMN transferase n=1 Tax=Phenylobacterium sp. TaxID=1871053 RepID=UPI0025ED182E|nr:FAD:protein FMN transferase [Phenylobacterium sp.]MBA4012379.1 thiamine biosynthesis protein ApbE [Phenylobacterium sp.]
MSRVAVPLDLSPRALQARGERPASFSGPTMGVSWNVKAFAPLGVELTAIPAQIQGLLNSLIAQMSNWEPESQISRFNRAAAGGWLDLAPAFRHVMDRALHWAELSEGAFDPTAGRLVELWGFGPAGPTPHPTDADLAAARADCGWDRLARDGARMFQPGGLHLDLSGIAKGFGVDKVSRALSHLGLIDHLVEIGGELRGAGVKPDGQPWLADIAAPPGASLPGGPIRVALHGLSLATSGDYQRFVDHDGTRYSHTLDPRTGRPTANGLRSVSVVARDCIDADALCTAIGVLGPHDGCAFAVRHDIAAYLLVDNGDGLSEILTPAFEAMLA